MRGKRASLVLRSIVRDAAAPSPFAHGSSGRAERRYQARGVTYATSCGFLLSERCSMRARAIIIVTRCDDGVGPIPIETCHLTI